MNWFTKSLTSGIGRKVIMSVSGLFLVFFLVAHLVGNLQLLLDDNGEKFNDYAYFMMHNPLIQVVAWITKIAILIHMLVAIGLTIANQRARPVAYAKNNAGANSHWTSRNMLLFGFVIFVFIGIHLIQFWAKAHWGEMGSIDVNDVSVPNLYEVVKMKFQELWVVLFYVISMAIIAFHLWHGTKSAFQSIGMRHPLYNSLIGNLSATIAVLLPIGFAIIPLYIYLKF